MSARARRERLRRTPRGGKPTGTQWLLAAALLPAVAAVVGRRKFRVPPAVSLALVSVAPLVVAAATPRRRWRYAVVGGAYMWAFTVTWTLPYERPERLRERLHVDYPVRVDSLLGLGIPPTQRLQRAFCRPGRVTTLDRAVTLVYATWFVPHVLLAWLLFSHDKYVPRAAGRLAAAYHLTTPLYYLVPTAPPWWASEEAGLMDGEVRRVRRRVLNDLLGRPLDGEDSSPGNPWASMPSDHVSSAAITAMGLAELGPVYGALGWTYVALASFSVVYLGEHYVIDVLAGLGIATVIHRYEAKTTPLVHRVVLAIDRFAYAGRR